jgi:hypothetical protein
VATWSKLDRLGNEQARWVLETLQKKRATNRGRKKMTTGSVSPGCGDKKGRGKSLLDLERASWTGDRPPPHVPIHRRVRIWADWGEVIYL